jgi:hypothetical protein
MSVVEATKEDAGDDEVATAVDRVEDGGERGTTGGIGEDVVAGHFHLALNMAGRHQGSGNARGVIREDVLGATMGVAWDLEIAVADGAMDVAVGGAEDDIAALLGVVATVGVEELELVGRSGLGPVVEVGTYFQRIRFGAGRGGSRRDGAAGANFANVIMVDVDHFGANGVGVGGDVHGSDEMFREHFGKVVSVGAVVVGVGVRVGDSFYKDGRVVVGRS